MRKEMILLDPKADHGHAKRVFTESDPARFFPAATGLGHRILKRLAKGPDYPSSIAREMRVYHQAVYYHIRSLEKAGLVRRVGETTIRGGRAQRYALASDGYAIEFEVPGSTFSSPASASRSDALGRFAHEFFPREELDGWVVVGSPEPHGPNRTQGKDGHYAIQLGFALGQFVHLPRSFPVKLDVDLKTEKLSKSNLLVIGGPRTNLISGDLNNHMPIRFLEESFWGAIVDEQGNRYLSEFDALIAKFRNPWDVSKVCIVAAGLSGAATKGAVIGLTNLAEETLAGYQDGTSFAAVVRGVDMDGDGKVDSVEILHRYSGP